MNREPIERHATHRSNVRLHGDPASDAARLPPHDLYTTTNVTRWGKARTFGCMAIQLPECSGATAEISSHHRPIDWEVLGHMISAATGQKLTGAQQKLADEDPQRPLRALLNSHPFIN